MGKVIDELQQENGTEMLIKLYLKPNLSVSSSNYVSIQFKLVCIQFSLICS